MFFVGGTFGLTAPHSSPPTNRRQGIPRDEARSHVHEMFEHQVERHPDAVALVCAEERLTYGELNRRSNHLARHLRRLGAATDVLLPIVMSPCAARVVAILGALKAGAAWLPLDPEDPEERLAFVLDEARSPIVLTEERFIRSRPLLRERGFALDRWSGGTPGEDGENLDLAIDPAAIAYGIYTSGSTGRPKGVLVPHAALANHTRWMQAEFPLDPGDAVVQKTPFTFDAAVWEFIAPLVAGARLVLAGHGAHRDPASLVRLMTDERVTILQMVPTGLRALLEEPGLEGCRALRRVFCGGEALRPDLVQRFSQRLDARLVNLYGPTEACIDSTSWVCKEHEDPVPIGGPIHGVRARVLDPQLRPQRDGIAGDLYVAGAGLARGYLGRPDLTAERFLPDPHASAPGQRMYATGDRARLRPDGMLEFLGRIDEQVKVRGYRIEPGEIEAVLNRNAAVAESVVVAREGAGRETILVAYLKPRPGRDPGLGVPNVEALREHLRQALPDHMIPSAFVVLEEMPRTASGKIDRRNLPAPRRARPDLAVPFVAPRSEDERRVAALWAELLGVDRVGVGDGFFDLGGHSLVAVQVIARLRGLFGAEVPVRALFESPTVEGLVARLATARRLAPSGATAPSPRDSRDRVRPLSFAQQRLWFLDQLDPGHPFYNMPSTLRLRGPLDVAALRNGLDAIVRRHEVLRTAFPAVDGKPVAVVDPGPRSTLAVEDLTHLPPTERWPEALRKAKREAQQPFDLERGPLFRPRLLRLGAEDYLLLLTFHHIVTDGWSEGVFYRELEALYASFVSGRAPPLADPPMQYADYAAWQSRFLQNERLETEIDHWRRALEGAPTRLDLATDRPRPAIRTHRGARNRVTLSGGLSEGLRALGRAAAATPFMIVLAAWNVLLRAYTGHEDILVGTPIANRTRLEIEDLIGFFVNTLVLRTDLSGDPTFRELLQRVRAAALEAYAHQDLPFEKLVEALRPARDLGRTALFQVMVAHGATPRVRLPGIEAEFVDIDDGISKFDLTLDVDDSQGPIVCRLEYSTDLFDAARARRILRHLETVLEGIADDPDRRLSRLPVLPDEEHQLLLAAWNGPQDGSAAGQTVHHLIETRASRAPDATAVCSGERRIAYAGLDRSASTLARRLVALGAGPDRPIGLCVERSIEMVSGLLGILKAGAAYLPLDPTYPKERLTRILQEAGPPVVLAQRRLLALLPATANVLCLEDVQEMDPGAGPSILPKVAPDNLAYILHTSGSTGIPKGVLVPHRGLANHAVETARLYGLGPADRVLQFASLSFDVAAEEIFPTLLSGAMLVLRPDPVFVSVVEFHRFLENEKITVLNLPTSYWHAWVGEIERDGHLVPSTLRCVVIGSEKALASRLAAWNELTGGGIALFNAYGPTEATITSTIYASSGRETRGAGDLVPIGRPIANARVYVLDRCLNLAPAGVPGELCIGGEGVARGYLGRPDFTAERFMPDPFGTAPGARLYRTGDRARWLGDGNLEFIGRLDDQVKVRGHRIEPAEIERALERHDAIAESVVLAREDTPGEMRLVAYLACRPGTRGAPTTAALRSHLKEILPEHMVPSAFVWLERWPRTPSGKIDRRGLPAPGVAPDDGATQRATPGTPAEETLARIWGEVFGGPRPGIHDNFFELGGDSILAIQIVSRANQAGLRLTSRHIFQHQTIADLAAVAGTRLAATAEQGAVTGEAPLTPIQRWFFEHAFADRHHFNQAVLLEPKEPLDPDRLETAFGHLLEHHDALRLRFGRSDGTWRQWHAPPGGPVPFQRVDLSALPGERRAAALEEEAAALQRGLDLERGPLMRIALFTLGPGAGARLLIVIHHLAVDGVSWRILLEDLNTVYRQLERGDSVALPAKTTSYKAWAERLAERARETSLEPELEYWLAQGRRGIAGLPVDDRIGDDLEGSARVVTSAFTEDETRALLRDLPAVWRTEINDVLLTALAQAVAGWTGRREVLVDLEGHGREEILHDVDLSRTVGWFTTIKPVRLVLEDADVPEAALKLIKEQLRALPARGIGYGLLRYMKNDDVGDLLRALPPAEISFNYLGQFDASVPESSPFRFASESTGPVASPRGRRTHRLEVGGYVASGRLRINWKYGAGVHTRHTVQALARRFDSALRLLIARGTRADSLAFTPSDFPMARLDQPDIDLLARAHPRLEDVYPLTPMQEGMLFHTLSAPESGVYVEHLTWKFRGSFDEKTFVDAWRRATERHPILRTAFEWERLDRPLQVVTRSVAPSWERLDWRDRAAEEQEREHRRFLASDMRRGYDLSRPPLQRFAIMRLADHLHQFVWSHHHVLLDGWSLPVLLKEVMTLYQALRAGEEPHLEEPRPFRDYVAWLRRQDLGAAERYWRRALAGFRSPTSLVVDRKASRPARPEDYRLERVRFSGAAAARLRALARRHQLTLNTILQGAWALLLGRYGGSDDVAFGGVVSGRPADLEGSERMVGLLLNTLPIRVRIEEGRAVAEWLKRLQENQVEMRQYEYTPLVQVQEWSEMERGTPLFESIFVFENYPLDQEILERVGDLEILDLRAVEWTHYPLNVVIPPGPGLSIQISYDARRFEAAAIRRMLCHLETVLEGMAARPDGLVGDLPMSTAAERAWLELRSRPGPATAGRCLHEGFEMQVEQRPDAIAVVCEGRRVTYAELNRRANRLARRLSEHGVGPETRVAISLPRSIEMIEATLAVLKAGGAYVPLDPAYPAERLAFVQQDAGVAATIARRETLAGVAAHHAPVVLVEGTDGAAAAVDDTNLPSTAQPDHPAYVIYTSGSTGRSKGVVVTHRSAAALFDATRERLGFDERDVWTQLHSPAFDYSVWETWGALLHGGRLVLVPPLIGRSPDELHALLRRERVTVLSQTPAEFRQLIVEDERHDGVGLPVRLVNIGGEALNLDDVKPWVARHPDRPLLVNLYGITETTVVVTWRPLRAQDVDGGGVCAIGEAIPSWSVRLLDARMRPVPIGVPGEIYVGGAGLARGYLGRPDLTAERFVPDPFSEIPGRRLYRSGDLARYREDGDLEYLGRIDDQIKVRGFRIEPGEVEAALLAHPDVREVVVVASREGSAAGRLVAYVVTRPGREEAAGGLGEFLRRSLPDYMVPSTFVRLETLPTTPNGKVDRRALPAPEAAPGARGGSIVPPATPIEEELARLWGGLLGVERPGVEDNFFEAGGQSLLATLLVSRVRAHLGAEVSLKDFLDRPTIRALACLIEAAYLRAASPSELDAMLGLMDGTRPAEAQSLDLRTDTAEGRRVEDA